MKAQLKHSSQTRSISSDRPGNSGASLIVKCPFAAEVWLNLEAWAGDAIRIPQPDLDSVETWWLSSIEHQSSKQQRTTSAFILYSAWKVWKGRNWRIFEGSASTPAQVFAPTREETALRRQACGRPWID